MLWILRIALYVQVILGITRFLGWIPEGRIWETHVSLAILIPILAAIHFRPMPGRVRSGIRNLARWFPLVPLLLGGGLYFQILTGSVATWLHMLSGLAAVGLVDAAAARERRRGI